ncbi:MAG TPA: hemolysin family protein [Nocardioides sp.]|uniref:hemolysin family protein n=1 Tax=Nocardioides sp. TaxID=35761 RepID=UPI002D7EFB31|nr:hemolysin family protein [Nocardioides sp.]HET6652937.1 hemolysin family protein [Nocardioides sp.]
MTEVPYLLVSLVLIVACGIFVAAEFAFVTVDRASVDRAAEAGDRGARGVQSALKGLSTQLSGAQVGITLTNLVIGYLAEPAIAQLVDDPLAAAGLPASWVRPVSVGIGLGLATVLTMLFGELVPKNLAIARPLGTAKATQAFQRGFTAAMKLPIAVLNGSANAIVRRLGIEPQEELRSARNSDELASLVRRSASQGTLDAGTARLMERSVTFADRMAGEIMTPRVRMDSVRTDAPVAAVVEAARRTGHSRFPVVLGGDDDVVGAVHVKNAVAVPADRRGTVPVSSVMVEPTVVPESLRLDPLLALLKEEGFQMAVVVDEYGGTAGVVTLEDVVEEIVGDIADEHDRLGSSARRRRDGSVSVSGMLRPDEVESATGVELPEHEDYDTVAGLIMQRLGRMAAPGDAVVVPLPRHADDEGDSLPPQVAELRVERLDGLRIDRVSVRTRAATAGDRAEGAGR